MHTVFDNLCSFEILFETLLGFEIEIQIAIEYSGNN
jgi:hypothetical protein